jgi:DNA-binding GntR family transcriptional regulator
MVERRQRRADQIRLELEQRIVTGALEPGARLEEQGLADEFGVSRTPVREALAQLASMDLVELRPRQGAQVKLLSLRDLVDIFDVMAELEGMCARLAARRITAGEREQLQAAHDETKAFVAAGDADGYYAANARFHEIIYAASHNHFLKETAHGIRNRCAPYRRLQLRQVGRIAKSYAEHGAILAAILSGNEERSNQLARAHILIQGEVFNDFVAALPASLFAQRQSA